MNAESKKNKNPIKNNIEEENINDQLLDTIRLLKHELTIERFLRNSQGDFILNKDREAIIDSYLKNVGKVFQYLEAVVFFIDENFLFEPRISHRTNSTSLQNAIALMEQGVFAWCLNRQKASLIPDDKFSDATILLVPIIGKEPVGVIYFEAKKEYENIITKFLSVLNMLSREAGFTIESINFQAIQVQAKQLELKNKELTKANEIIGKLVIEKDHVFKDLQASQLELSRKARGLEENNKELNRINKKLKETQLELEKHGKNLESKVTERTRELKSKNTQLLDITKKLKQTNDKLKKADQLKNDFLSFTAHELRTPLTSIKAFAEILLTEPKAMKKKDDFLNTINEEADRLTRLINELLELVKIESNKFVWEIKAIKPDVIINRVFILFESLANKESVHLATQIERNLPQFYSDQDRIIQVFTNILGNAVKFSPDNSTVVIKAFQENSDSSLIKKNYPHPKKYSSYLVFSIDDQGPGFCEEDKVNIFQKFKQVKGRTGRFKGTGLGLPISKEIITSLDGALWVESDLGKGSSFKFVLPVFDKEESKAFIKRLQED